MSIVWIDGFDHYGNQNTGRDNMLAGAWTQLSGTSNPRPDSTNPRTGTYAMRFNNGVSDQGARRNLGAGYDVVGMGFAIYLPNLPTLNDRFCVMSFSNGGNIPFVSIVVQSTGAIAAKAGEFDDSAFGTSTTLLTALAYHHLECWVRIDGSSGSVEFRLDGVTILNLTGINTGTGNVEQVSVGRGAPFDSGVTGWDVDDIFVANNSGTQNNSFLGDKRVWPIFPDADTEEADWVPNSGTTGYTQINETSPDGDTSYVEAAAPAESSQQVSDYGVQALPAEVVAVAAIMMQGMLKKTDAGTCTVKQSVLSSGQISSGSLHPLTTAYTYYQDVFELDPNTSAPWTPTAVGNALIRYERTE